MHDGTSVFTSAGSTVSHPVDYLGGGLEVWDICEAHCLGHHLSSALEYILRSRCKGRECEDLRTAGVWIGRALEVRAPLRVLLQPQNAMWGVDPPSPTRVARAFGLSERMERVVALVLTPNPTRANLSDAVHWLDLEVSEISEATVAPGEETVAVAAATPADEAALGEATVVLTAATPAADRLALAVLRLEAACEEGGLHWMLAKGRMQHDEPLWGLGIFSTSHGLSVDTGVALVLAEADSPDACIDIALDMLVRTQAGSAT